MTHIETLTVKLTDGREVKIFDRLGPGSGSVSRSTDDNELLAVGLAAADAVMNVLCPEPDKSTEIDG